MFSAPSESANIIRPRLGGGSGKLDKYKSIRKIISQLLMREGDNPMMICNFYKVVTQSVLMNGLDTWALMGILLGILEWMHWGVAQMIFLMGGRYFTGTWGHITTL